MSARVSKHRPGQRPIDTIIRPFQEFAHTAASGGVLLLAFTVVALIWANSPWSHSYHELWHTPVTAGFGGHVLSKPLELWINDGLMAIFFFVVGLEIKREVVHGELSSPKSAALPVIAAIGGMTVPALVYLAFNSGGDASSGWAIPVATDIAFAVGVLALVGNRVPFSLKVFLLALAIADDLGGIIVIAVFYTEAISIEALLWAAAILVAINMFRVYGIRTLNVYIALGALLWVAVLKSGIHATVAGVVLAIMTPSRAYYDPSQFTEQALVLLRRLPRDDAPDGDDYDARETVLEELEDLSRGSEAPLDRLEHMLSPWVSYLIVPIFALANAGVVVTGQSVGDAAGSGVTWGVILGLFIGKPVGITLATWLAVRTGIANKPQGVSWLQIVGVGILGGVGFTVALFITELSFDSEVLINDAKMGILAGSFVAAIAGFAFLRIVPGSAPEPGTSGQRRGR